MADRKIRLYGHIRLHEFESSAHQVADLTMRFPGRMQPGNLNTIIMIELVISLAHRNSVLYRCCTSLVILGAS